MPSIQDYGDFIQREAYQGGKKSKDHLLCQFLLTWKETKNTRSPLQESPRIPDALRILKFSLKFRLRWSTKILDLFTEAVKSGTESRKKKVAPIVDNYRAHPDIPGLKAIRMFYLPLNTISNLQPMGQGIIQVLKEIIDTPISAS